MAITKKVVVDCMKRELAQSLKDRKPNKPMHQRPLWAWMRGAHISDNPSKIEMVLDNKCRWPWKTLKASGEVFTIRIESKKTLPWIQKRWLHEYIARKYQGAYGYAQNRLSDDFSFNQTTERLATNCEIQVNEFIAVCLEKCGIEQHKIPLRLILSAELSCLINLKFMELYL